MYHGFKFTEMLEKLYLVAKTKDSARSAGNFWVFRGCFTREIYKKIGAQRRKILANLQGEITTKSQKYDENKAIINMSYRFRQGFKK